MRRPPLAVADLRYTYACGELQGKGWRARVKSRTTTSAVVVSCVSWDRGLFELRGGYQYTNFPNEDATTEMGDITRLRKTERERRFGVIFSVFIVISCSEIAKIARKLAPGGAR